VDNICHTLTGLALGEAGLKRRAPLANATLMIAANIPDIDVLVFATDVPSVAFRRGWTHGILAQVALPLVLASVMYAIARRRNAALRQADFAWILLLSQIGVLSHVGLDWLNNYGVRLLMPLSPQWFYGDSVFIIDIWLWAMLGIGAWVARKRATTRPAQMALVMAVAYIAVLVVSAREARQQVIDAWRERQGRLPVALMVGPQPVTPIERIIILDDGDEYVTGTFRWDRRDVMFDAQRIAKNDTHPAVRAAVAQDPRFPAVLIWARFPYYEIESTPAGAVVTLRDLRFGERVGGVRAVVAASTGSSRPADRSR
jgi:inner membrane protein